MSADSEYNDHELYDFSTYIGCRLVCPVQRYKNTLEERIKLIEFYISDIGQAIYLLRNISIQPLIDHIKSSFRIYPLSVRRYAKTCATVLLSVLLYQIIKYYNCKTDRDNLWQSCIG